MGGMWHASVSMSNTAADGFAEHDARRDCDVIVVGGGPAGSTAASWLARAGLRVMLFERDRFPRFHIGESLLASVNDVLGAIGADELVRQAGFPQKWGATFLSADGRIERYADFSVAPGVRRPQTWQVPRAHFDDLLLRHASQSGADVREGHRVIDIDVSDAEVTALVQDAQSGDGGRRTIRAQAVIDASGRASVLARKFNLRVDEPRLANVAVFSHYTGVPRQDGRRAGDIRIVARDDLGWFWLIPISDDLVSVGVVLPAAAARAFRMLPHEAWLESAIAGTPVVAQLMATAHREWPVRVEKDFSYASRAYAGARWFLAGDAGSFLDPVFSTGVAIALESGLEAAQAAARSIETGNWTGPHVTRYTRRQWHRYKSFRRFVVGFYTPAFRDLFFSNDPPRRIFRSVVAVFAGYWRPSVATRAWVALFFLLIRAQGWFGFVPRLVSNATPQPADGSAATNATRHYT
jgi:flavin-dependent dehydrogenase